MSQFLNILLGFALCFIFLLLVSTTCKLRDLDSRLSSIEKKDYSRKDL